MNHADFLCLTRSLAAEEGAAPAANRARLWRWVVGAHVALIFLAVLPVAVFAGLFWAARVRGMQPAGMGVVAMLVTGLVASILWSALAALIFARRPAPQGLDFDRTEAQGLFSELDRLCAEMKVAPFDGVLLSNACNAMVSEGPRPGRQGRRRYLVLGVPLLQGLSPEEMRAVLAHELAHRGIAAA
jgi:Zn-dependent protease with chaperone function